LQKIPLKAIGLVGGVQDEVEPPTASTGNRLVDLGEGTLGKERQTQKQRNGGTICADKKMGESF